MNSGYGWQRWQQTWIGSSASSNVTMYPYALQPVPSHPRPLRWAVEGPSGDREWLDAQIAEVCEMATAA